MLTQKKNDLAQLISKVFQPGKAIKKGKKSKTKRIVRITHLV